MRILSPKLDVPLSSPHLPSPIMFRSAQVPAGGVYPQHQHAWGEFVYSFSGIMEVKLADRHYLAHLCHFPPLFPAKPAANPHECWIV